MIIKRYNLAANEQNVLGRLPGFKSIAEAEIWRDYDANWKTYEITIEVKEYVPPPAEIKISVEDSI